MGFWHFYMGIEGGGGSIATFDTVACVAASSVYIPGAARSALGACR